MSSEPAAIARRALVVDANILVRAVLGRRVLSLLRRYAGTVDFITAETAYDDLRVHLPTILTKRGLSPDEVVQLLQGEILRAMPALVTPIPTASYVDFEKDARTRLIGRDELDWPFVALAMKFDCPIWTEDQDFFGTGIPTWTTDRIHICLESS